MIFDRIDRKKLDGRGVKRTSVLGRNTSVDTAECTLGDFRMLDMSVSPERLVVQELQELR